MAGEISPDTMFCKESIKTCMEHSSRVSMGLMGEVGCMGRGGKAKTRTKRGKTDEQDMFFNTCHGAEKSESRQGW